MVPVLLGVLWWQLYNSPSLPGNHLLTSRIAAHAGANLLSGISSRLLVATHVFLEVLHYVCCPPVDLLSGWIFLDRFDRDSDPVAGVITFPPLPRSDHCRVLAHGLFLSDRDSGFPSRPV
jgi:hypothetical protein